MSSLGRLSCAENLGEQKIWIATDHAVFNWTTPLSRFYVFGAIAEAFENQGDNLAQTDFMKREKEESWVGLGWPLP